ncbi:hypothetical protein MINS_12310 [Mycolicibacterium insubricum]|nr:hypothetical protein MINS_12310 [Mycolicibacterium insubricum]
MDARKCHRCGLYWASNSGPDKQFTGITRICPNCIPLSTGLLSLHAARPATRQECR